jgi:hypothetical protein
MADYHRRAPVALGALALTASLCTGAVRQQTQAVSCDRSPSARAEAFLAAPHGGANDSVVTVWVCINRRSDAPAFGSYRGELVFDSLAARVASVQHAAEGMRLENDREPGRVVFAGASTTGFSGGTMLTVRLALKTRGRVPPLALHVSELNDVAGVSMVASLRVESGGKATTDSCVEGTLRLRALVPSSVDLSAGDVTPIDVLGCGFADANTVNVGPVTMNGVPSLDRGTRIRIVVPLTLPARGEVPPMRMPTGVVDVTVTARNATSNRLPLVLK